MPAKLLHRIKEEGSYCHIYNKSFGDTLIFNDKEDYEVFQNFLSEYLSSPKSLENAKKEFVVKGRTFHGVPHLPKNYAGRVELLAFRLIPNRFDLLLRQIEKGSLENFMRSLSTRYSIYFNKKYQRKGTLFEGPYKSIHIKDEAELLPLTRELHSTAQFSSMPEYLGNRETSWIKPNTVLASLKESSSYKEYLEKYKPDQTTAKPLVTHPTIEALPVSKAPFRFFEIAAATGIFMVLLALGVRNIKVSQASASQASLQGSSVLSVSTFSTPTPTPTPIGALPAGTEIIIKTATTSAAINIREKPTTDSKIIGTATDGQIFKAISTNSGWYGVQLENGSIGYIFGDYLETYKTN